jgi:hypothetical protein
MLSSRIETEADLRNELERLLTMFKEQLLYEHLSSLPRKFTNTAIAEEIQCVCQNNRISGYDNSSNAVFEHYGALIEWCNKKVDDDLYQPVKQKFLAIHTKALQEFLTRRVEAQEKALNALGNRYEQLKKNNKTKLMQLHDSIAEQYAQLGTLCTQTNKLLDNVLRKPDDDFDLPGFNRTEDRLFVDVIKLLKRRVEQQKIEKNTLMQETISKPTGPTIERADVVNDQKLDLVKRLDKAVTQYKDILENENLLVWLVTIFSPVRWRRWSALNEYDRKVSTARNLFSKYGQASAWVTKHAQTQEFKDEVNRISRFYYPFFFKKFNIFGKKTKKKLTILLQ